MKASELMELLEKQDPNAEVLVMSQPDWPFELGLAGAYRSRRGRHLVGNGSESG